MVVRGIANKVLVYWCIGVLLVARDLASHLRSLHHIYAHHDSICTVGSCSDACVLLLDHVATLPDYISDAPQSEVPLLISVRAF